MCLVTVESLYFLSLFLLLSFKCRQMYHAPTDCATIRKWLTKCADDSETANYISAHTKDVRRIYTCTHAVMNIDHNCFFSIFAHIL